MLKTRIILIVISVIAVLAIYNLPKGIIKNAEVASEAETDKETTDTHDLTFSPEEIATLQRLQESLSKSTDNEKSAIFADSLAFLFRSKARFDSAAVYSEQMAKLIPGRDHWYQAGADYYEAFTFSLTAEKARILGDKAREFFEKVLEEEPGNMEVKSKIAMTHIGTSNPMKGIMMLREIVQEDPENQDAIFNLGILAIQSGQLDRAEERFVSLLEVNPLHVEGNFYLGVVYFENGKPERAKEQFQKVKEVTTDPEVIANADNYLEELR